MTRPGVEVPSGGLGPSARGAIGQVQRRARRRIAEGGVASGNSGAISKPFNFRGTALQVAAAVRGTAVGSRRRAAVCSWDDVIECERVAGTCAFAVQPTGALGGEHFGSDSSMERASRR